MKNDQGELKLTLYAIPYESMKAASQPPRFEPEPSQPTQSGSRGCAGEQVTQDWVQWGNAGRRRVSATQKSPSRWFATGLAPLHARSAAI